MYTLVVAAECGIMLLQAYVYTLLTGFYLSEAIGVDNNA